MELESTQRGACNDMPSDDEFDVLGAVCRAEDCPVSSLSDVDRQLMIADELIERNCVVYEIREGFEGERPPVER